MTFSLKRFIKLILFLFIIQSANAQKHEWVKYFTQVDSTFSYAIPRNIDIDQEGGIVSSGYKRGKVDFDPGPQTFTDSSSNFLKGFVNKLDSDGQFQFHKNINYNQWITFNESDLDYHNNIIFAGRFNDTLVINELDTIFTLDSTASRHNSFIIKLDKTGQIKWAKSIQGDNFNAFHEVVVDQENNIYVLGYVEDTVDINMEDTAQYSIENEGQTDFIMKLDSNGVFQWAKTFRSDIWNLGINQFGQIFFVGRYSDTTSLNTLQNGVTTLFPIDNVNFLYGLINNQSELKWVKSFHSNQSVSSSTFEDFPSDQNGNFHHFGTYENEFYLGDNPSSELQVLF
jgi:hypothetical protein